MHRFACTLMHIDIAHASCLVTNIFPSITQLQVCSMEKLVLLNTVLAFSSPFYHPAIQQTTAWYTKEMCYIAGISAFYTLSSSFG